MFPTLLLHAIGEERIAQDVANAAKKGYKVDYRGIHETTAAEAKDV